MQEKQDKESVNNKKNPRGVEMFYGHLWEFLPKIEEN